MGAFKYTITVESDTPPQVLLGQNFDGGKVTALKLEELPNLVSVSWLVNRYGFTKATILKKLDGHNKGTDNKHLYDPKVAMQILSSKATSKRGTRRVH